MHSTLNPTEFSKIILGKSKSREYNNNKKNKKSTPSPPSLQDYKDEEDQDSVQSRQDDDAILEKAYHSKQSEDLKKGRIDYKPFRASDFT
jgi:hypothetical protein